MKLTKTLMRSGVLGHGRVRHCSEWEFHSINAPRRPAFSALLREAERRRAQAERRQSVWERVVGQIFGKRDVD